MPEAINFKFENEKSFDKIIAHYEFILEVCLRLVFVVDKNIDLIFDIMPIIFAILADPDFGEKYENSIELLVTFMIPFIFENIEANKEAKQKVDLI